MHTRAVNFEIRPKTPVKGLSLAQNLHQESHNYSLFTTTFTLTVILTNFISTTSSATFYSAVQDIAIGSDSASLNQRNFSRLV